MQSLRFITSFYCGFKRSVTMFSQLYFGTSDVITLKIYSHKNPQFWSKVIHTTKWSAWRRVNADAQCDASFVQQHKQFTVIRARIDCFFFCFFLSLWLYKCFVWWSRIAAVCSQLSSEGEQTVCFFPNHSINAVFKCLHRSFFSSFFFLKWTSWLNEALEFLDTFGSHESEAMLRSHPLNLILQTV